MSNESLHLPRISAITPKDWRWSRLDQVCEGIFDCPHSTPQISLSGPYLARSQDIRSGVFRLDQAGRVSEETYEQRIRRAEPKRGDLLFSREGTYFGVAAEVPPTIRVCLGQRMVLLRPNSELADFRYLRYWINSPFLSAYMEGFRDGSVAERLNMSTIGALPVLLPPVGEQRIIADILGPFDDKIELNRRMNERLEAIARALFKSWFVDFDPVRAKAEGQQPMGMDAETAALFPEAFADSELGEIPRGWRLSTVGEQVRVVGGTTPSTKEAKYWEAGAIHWATPKDLAALASPVLIDTERKITELGMQQIGSGLLPAGTVLLSSRAPIGYMAISQVPISINQGFIAMVCDRELSNHYVLQWIRVNMETIIGRANGTTFLEISKSNFRPILILVPPQSILQQFDQQIEALHRKIVNNIYESRTLAALHDALLPKLITGEIQAAER